MSDLFMGIQIIPGGKKNHVLRAKELHHHLFVTGQSGSGKSSLVGRLIEEIIIRNAGNVLFLDCNYEFSRFSEINSNSFSESYNRRNCPEDNQDVFDKVWDQKRPGIRMIKASEINILYRDIGAYLKAPLLGIDRDRHPGAFWLLQMIEEHQVLKDKITSKDGLLKLIGDIARWTEGRAKDDEIKRFGLIIHEMMRNLRSLDLTLFINAAKRLNNQRYVNFKIIKDKYCLDESFVKGLFEGTSFCSVDLLNFPYEHYHFRDFIVFHLLYCIWKDAKARFNERKTANRDDDLKPLFIVIDEAHNLAPSKDGALHSPTAQEVARIVRTFAAEGRKFGLFLILVSQRPDKIDSNVLSECDNFIVMKSTLPTIKSLAEYLGTEFEQLKPAVSFKEGQAFYCGAFTPNRTPLKVEGDIKRTR